MLGILCLSLVAAISASAADEVRAQALADAQAGRWEAAEPVLETLAAAKPTDATVCAKLAERRLRQKRAKEAVELMERAIAAEPSNAAWHSQLGHALGQRIGEVNFMQQGMLAGKLRGAYEKSVALDPNHIPGYIGLARYYTNAPAIAGGSFEKAESFALEIEKRNEFTGRLERGYIAEKAEKYDVAVAHFRRAAELQPKDAWPVTAVGRALASKGDLAGARAAFNEALKLAPGFRPAVEALTALDAREGKKGDASAPKSAARS